MCKHNGDHIDYFCSHLTGRAEAYARASVPARGGQLLLNHEAQMPDKSVDVSLSVFATDCQAE
jgi:hypothetical protein